MPLDFDRPIVPTLRDPDLWLRELFSSQAARDGLVIRRKVRDIERFAGWDRFTAELTRRGYRAFENSGQVIIFCNHAPIQPIAPARDR
ncbi:hypothetical protein GCM10011358_13670 [Sinisalibacter lacisalsi]|uniref:N-(5'-phosphoribosyl)anthranilate isomerase n=2 Tax=Sinisalibacter lacisalsi TaxID=1526570 RepID=A0ABQ1QM33_9RHOB|nr:hypothetical protein GCM10011358_13670 [Sinisalibacter lacisalsi]